MANYTQEILKKINQLIDLVAVEPKTEKPAKLRMIKLLLGLKLDLLKLLAEKRKAVAGKREKTEEKEKFILKFIEEKGGRVGMDDLAGLGISGRSLRRYLKSLRKRGLVELEKDGREHFYKLIRKN